MNRATAITCFALIVHTAAPVQGQGTPHDFHLEDFNRPCGRLEYSATVSARSRKKLSGVSLDLIQWKEGASCCSGLTLVESTITNRNGIFRFKRAQPGRYFLVAHYGTATPTSEIVIGPPSKNSPACWQQQLVIDHAGRMQEFFTVTFDYGRN